MKDLFIVKFTFIKDFKCHQVGDTIETSVSVNFECNYRFSASLVVQRALRKLLNDAGIPHFVLRCDLMERV